MGLTTSNNTCWKRKKNPYMPLDGHIRKSTVSELYEFWRTPTSAFTNRSCPAISKQACLTLAQSRFQLATVALWNALSLELGWHALTSSLSLRMGILAPLADPDVVCVLDVNFRMLNSLEFIHSAAKIRIKKRNAKNN